MHILEFDEHAARLDDEGPRGTARAAARTAVRRSASVAHERTGRGARLGATGGRLLDEWEAWLRRRARIKHELHRRGRRGRSARWPCREDASELHTRSCCGAVARSTTRLRGRTRCTTCASSARSCATRWSCSAGCTTATEAYRSGDPLDEACCRTTSATSRTSGGAAGRPRRRSARSLLKRGRARLGRHADGHGPHRSTIWRAARTADPASASPTASRRLRQQGVAARCSSELLGATRQKPGQKPDKQPRKKGAGKR